MSTWAQLRTPLKRGLRHASRIGLSLLVLSMILGVLAPLPTASAEATVPPPRKQIDSNVIGFQFLSDAQGFVLGSDLKLWLLHAPFGNVPPGRTLVDTNVIGFQPLGA